MYVILCNLPLV